MKRVEAKLGLSGYPVYREDTAASRIYCAFFAFCLLAIVMPRSRKPLERPPWRPNSYVKTESLFNLKLELSICPMQWQRAESVQPRWGGIFITVDVGGEGISRVQDPDWLVFFRRYLGKRG